MKKICIILDKSERKKKKEGGTSFLEVVPVENTPPVVDHCAVVDTHTALNTEGIC